MAQDTVTVGVVNFAPVPGDVAATLAKIEANVREAASQGIELLAFPEMALVGADACADCLDRRGPCPAHLALAETIPGPSTERIASLAREHDMYVIFGLIERDPHDPERLYNAAAVIGPEGVLGSYRKCNLGQPPWLTEGCTFTPGEELPVWQTRFGTIGVLICYDFWLNPELARVLALKGADLLVNCTASFAGPGKRDFFVHITETRAAENVVYAMSANLVGGETGGGYGGADLDSARPARFSGCSVIAGPAFPRFNQIYALAEDTEEIVSATLSFPKLRRWRQMFPWRDWRLGHQRALSELIAREFAAFAEQPPRGGRV
jgi:predicted amidohydrolase